jgi:hypothetical protein
MSRKRKIRRTVGDIVAIPIDEDHVAFGLVLEEPLLALFDFKCEVGEVPTVEDIVRRPVAFRIWVMNHPIVDGSWRIVGRVAVPENLADAPWFFKQDPISGRVTITKTGAEEVSPAPNQAEALEPAAVWEPEHVIDRLRDHFNGRPNKWVEAMRLGR